MRRFGIVVTAAVLFSLLAASHAHADPTWWTGTTGDWHDSLNWDNGIPGSLDWAYIDNGGTAQISADAESSRLYAGYGDSGAVEQTGGTNTVGYLLYLGYSSGSSGAYNLSAGDLSVGSSEYIGRYGTGEFNQTGGTHTVGYLYLKDDSSYTLSGGTLSISNSAEVNGSFHFDNGDGVLNVNGGLVNFADGVIDGAGSASFNGAANSLTIFPTGFDPAAQFGSYNALGLVHTAGSTLVISGGEGFAGRGWIGDSVECQGTIVASGGSLDFRGGLAISDGGTLDSSNYNLTVDNGATVTIAASGGELSARNEYIGYSGTGEFNQNGGIHTVSSELRLGYSGFSGTYNQSGGTNTVGYLYLKDDSSYTLSGGTLSISDSAEVNGSFHFNNGAGVLNVNGGLVNFADGVIDGAGSASFTSAVNSLTIFPTGFDPAVQFGSYSALGLVHTVGSTLVISTGEGFAGHGYIGDPVECQGTIVASGGRLVFSGNILISNGGTLDLGKYGLTVDNGRTVTIAASGGELSVGSVEFIGRDGTGEFNQNGGIHTVGSFLSLGERDTGTYNLSGTGELFVGSNEYIGNSSTGEFNQDGGTHTVSNYLRLGDSSGSSGTYNLSAGELSVGSDEFIGSAYSAGTGEFNQDGGTHTVGSSLYLGYGSGSSGTYSFLDGELFVRGNICVKYGYFTDTGALNSGEIYLGGHFINQSEESELFSMVRTSLTIWGGSEEQPSVLDMNSIDYGADCAGLADNFALGTLVFEGNPVCTYYRLDSDVYTYGLALYEGAHLDLNGYTLYYVPLGQTYHGISPGTFDLGGTWVNGDIVAIVPEPGTLLLLAPGLVSFAAILRKKFRSAGV